MVDIGVDNTQLCHPGDLFRKPCGSYRSPIMKRVNNLNRDQVNTLHTTKAQTLIPTLDQIDLNDI